MPPPLAPNCDPTRPKWLDNCPLVDPPVELNLSGSSDGQLCSTWIQVPSADGDPGTDEDLPKIDYTDAGNEDLKYFSCRRASDFNGLFTSVKSWRFHAGAPADG